MQMIKCDSCKKIFSRYGEEGKGWNTLRVGMQLPRYNFTDFDLCAECVERLDFAGLIAKGKEEPDPVLDALRELVREEIDASRG